MNTQKLFDLTIGRLDHVLSLLVLAAKSGQLDEPNRQTLKHHAEDMIAAGQCILGKLGGVEGTPQPAPKRKPKIGDRVRDADGDEGTLTQLEPECAEGLPYRVRYHDGCTLWVESVEVLT